LPIVIIYQADSRRDLRFLEDGAKALVGFGNGGSGTMLIPAVK
jgi:hypothetical protein